VRGRKRSEESEESGGVRRERRERREVKSENKKKRGKGVISAIPSAMRTIWGERERRSEESEPYGGREEIEREREEVMPAMWGERDEVKTKRAIGAKKLKSEK
jgi:hypothetical protein